MKYEDAVKIAMASVVDEDDHEVYEAGVTWALEQARRMVRDGLELSVESLTVSTQEWLLERPERFQLGVDDGFVTAVDLHSDGELLAEPTRAIYIEGKSRAIRVTDSMDELVERWEAGGVVRATTQAGRELALASRVIKSIEG